LENGSVEVIDLGAGKWSRSIPGFKKTQGIAYIPSLNKLFVASGDDGMLRVFRGDSLELLDSIKLELGPNRVAYDPHKSILYVGYGGKDAGKDYGEIGIIDAKTDRHVGDHRLFTITRKTPMMVVLDTQSGKEVARLRAAGECDDVFFDAGRKRIYVIGGEGIISVFQQNDPDHYELVANVPSSVGIRTGYYFAKRDRFYVAVPAKGNEPAQVWTFEAED
jgi:DNA-binding beta-propeller fold protein YncE